ncbi:MAG TPA: lysyl oxidase family protein [Pyrinomonadaceae bacterium]|nr:lysyl oxidase family protein [Pyrinomonadaceae bacterium]
MRGLKALLIIIVTILAVATPTALSQRTSVGRLFPVYENGGKPDLVVDPQRFVSQMEIVDRNFDLDSCAIQEGVVGGGGYRRILRFDTVLMNSGDGDLIVGDRRDPNNQYAEWFEFAPCHGHFHIRDFSVYELLNTDRTVIIAAHKQGFCMEDSLKYDGDKSNGYNCAFQGITSGWGDWYFKQLTGQWIDITGVPEGDYIVRVSINTAGTFDEGTNKYVNSVETSIHIPDPRKKVTIDDSPAIVAK